jgi:hypothetical protein
MNKYTPLLLPLLVCVPFLSLLTAQNQDDSDRHRYRYWYCTAYSMTVEHPNYYSAVFRTPRRIGDESPYSQIREAWSHYLLESQGFLFKYDGLWKRFDDGKGEELYTPKCYQSSSEQEAQYDKDHTESGVKLKREGDGMTMSPGPKDPSNRSRHVETGWVYSGADDN